MARRIRGAFIILRVLLPFLLVLALLGATWWTVRQVVDATRVYGQELSAQLDEVREAVAEANEGLQAIGAFAAATTAAATEVLDRVQALTDTISIPLPRVEIPDFTIPLIDVDIDLPDFSLGDGVLDIPIPGVAALKDLTADLAEAGRRLGDPVVKVARLATVPGNLQDAASDTAAYAGEVRTVMWSWLRWIAVLLIGGALVWLATAIRPITDQLRTGWAMLRGRDTESIVASIEDRVRRLERQVAALR